MTEELGLFLKVVQTRTTASTVDGRVVIQFRTQQGVVTCELPPGHADTLIDQIRDAVGRAEAAKKGTSMPSN